MSAHCDECAPEFLECWDCGEKCRKRPRSLASSPCSEPLQWCFEVPEPAPEDIQMMAVLAQCLTRSAENIHSQDLRAAWEWFKAFGEARVCGIEQSNAQSPPER